jgi:multidrug efflux pump subunit AcrA (membrane-fusion protein)
MAIVDPTVVWFKANLFGRDYYRMDAPEGASVVVPGMDAPIPIKPDDLKVLSKGDLFERSSRTIPVLFEAPNPDELLKIGQIVQLEIYTSHKQESVVVPYGSVIDDDYGKFVFVQVAGESFEKRAVKTGIRSNGMLAIREGLSAGERIVTVGAYRVKLAATTRAAGNPHVH